jgi:hypothetical protein
MISKCFVVPYFGVYPPWMEHWLANSVHLKALGYDFLFDTDEADFRRRVRRILDIECPPMHGTGKVWDFRPALGLLYEEELTGFDFWGHTDFDCVYGRVDRFVSDEFLQEIDMHSDCRDYVNGCWSLYRNTSQMRDLFMEEPFWHPIMEDPEPSGWAEKQFSEIVGFAHDEGRLVKAWTQWQIFEPSELALLRLAPDNRLLCGRSEVFMAHFRRTKAYPAGCLP